MENKYRDDADQTMQIKIAPICTFKNVDKD